MLIENLTAEATKNGINLQTLEDQLNRLVARLATEQNCMAMAIMSAVTYESITPQQQAEILLARHLQELKPQFPDESPRSEEANHLKELFQVVGIEVSIKATFIGSDHLLEQIASAINASPNECWAFIGLSRTQAHNIPHIINTTQRFEPNNIHHQESGFGSATPGQFVTDADILANSSIYGGIRVYTCTHKPAIS